MEKVTKEFYAIARSDKEFNNDLKNQDSLFFSIDWLWSYNVKYHYCTLYTGWLIGKGKHNDLKI